MMSRKAGEAYPHPAKGPCVLISISNLFTPRNQYPSLPAVKKLLPLIGTSRYVVPSQSFL